MIRRVRGFPRRLFVVWGVGAVHDDAAARKDMSWTGSPPYNEQPAREILALAESFPEDARLVMRIEGTNIEGHGKRKTWRYSSAGQDGTRAPRGGRLLFGRNRRGAKLASVRFGSRAGKVGLEQGWRVVAIDVPADRPQRTGYTSRPLLSFSQQRLCSFTRWIPTALSTTSRRLPASRAPRRGCS